MSSKNSLDLLMQRTGKDLREIACIEHVPYSGSNKRALAERIIDYRVTVGSLYRKNCKELHNEAKIIGFAGYTKMKKGELIDGLIRLKTVIKPRIKAHRRSMQGFNKNRLRELSQKEVLREFGQTKDCMMENTAKHRILGEYDVRSKQVRWIKHQDHRRP